MLRRHFSILVGLAFITVLSCAPPPNGPPPAAGVKGTINMDGKPVPSGEIHFGMLGAPPHVVPISAGRFAGEAPIGKCKVEVFIYVEGPPSEKYPTMPTKTNIVPEKYWGPNTSLEATVNAGGGNELKFEITSK
jgi:hypothetical protein